MTDHIFSEYVFEFMDADIRREIQMAEVSEGHTWLGLGEPPWPTGGGNLLAALGQLCYTEFLGSFISGKTKRHARRNFESFFARLGPCYEELAKAHDVYEIFRCGMVHEYAVKRDCTIYMKSGSEACVAPDGAEAQGVRTAADTAEKHELGEISDVLANASFLAARSLSERDWGPVPGRSRYTLGPIPRRRNGLSPICRPRSEKAH